MFVSDTVGGSEWAVAQILGKAGQMVFVDRVIQHVQTI